MSSYMIRPADAIIKISFFVYSWTQFLPSIPDPTDWNRYPLFRFMSAGARPTLRNDRAWVGDRAIGHSSFLGGPRRREERHGRVRVFFANILTRFLRQYPKSLANILRTDCRQMLRFETSVTSPALLLYGRLRSRNPVCRLHLVWLFYAMKHWSNEAP